MSEEIQTIVQENQKVQAWIDPNLHRKVKSYAGILQIDMKEFVSRAIQYYTAELEKTEIPKHIKDLMS